MRKRTRLIIFTSLFTLTLGLVILSIIVVNSKYYKGFEGSLIYLSPDLSENRCVIRESFYSNKSAKIKLVFETKDSSIIYDYSQFKSFINGLVVQIWNESEYYEFEASKISFFGERNGDVQIPIGSIKGSGRYFVYINSDLGSNGAYKIGIGVGRESKYRPLGNNVRTFY